MKKTQTIQSAPAPEAVPAEKKELTGQDQSRFRLAVGKLFEFEISGQAETVEQIAKRYSLVTVFMLLIGVLAAPLAAAKTWLIGKIGGIG